MWLLPWLYSLVILLSADVELNPGPKLASTSNISICHWNLNCISAHNYTKLFLLQAYIAVHKFDIICLSETYLDSSTISNDDNLVISGNNCIRSDHPSNNKYVGVCIYYKNFLPLRVLSIQYLQKCINFELNIGGKICNFISLHRSPSQTKDEFEKFIDNLELNFETLCQNNPFLIVLIGDLNAKSKNWYCHDKSSHEGNSIENVTAQFGLQQIIKEPTHVSNTSSSCIDLIFTSQPNLITDSGVHSSLHPNCHHQIVFAKLNLHIVYPPPYLQEIWHYREANTGLIRRAIKEFNWERAFSNISVNEKVDIFNRTILNILSNFIPHEIIVCDDKDPPWFNNRIKTLIQEKNATYKIYRHSKDNLDLIYHLQFLQERLSTSIESSKERYYASIANRLNNTKKNTKTCWSLLKNF